MRWHISSYQQGLTLEKLAHQDLFRNDVERSTLFVWWKVGRLEPSDPVLPDSHVFATPRVRRLSQAS
jgi:hypothetical protein